MSSAVLSKIRGLPRRDNRVWVASVVMALGLGSGIQVATAENRRWMSSVVFWDDFWGSQISTCLRRRSLGRVLSRMMSAK